MAITTVALSDSPAKVSRDDSCDLERMKFLTRTVTLSTLLTVFGLALWTVPVTWASQSHSSITVAQAGLTAEEAAAMVQTRTGGRILALETIRSQERVVYRVKVLTPDGEVRIFYVDAATGAM